MLGVTSSPLADRITDIEAKQASNDATIKEFEQNDPRWGRQRSVSCLQSYLISI